MYSFWMLIIVFFIYSVLGYITEVTSCSIKSKKLVLSRGYLIGPYIPIFGFGSIIMIYLLKGYKDDIFALFVNSMVSTTFLEYITSFLLEKIYNLRWWDYSNRKFNINGRVCLENGMLFGIAGVIIVRYFNPILMDILYELSNTTVYILGISIGIIILSDFILSTFTISKLKIDTTKYINMDSTQIIREELLKSIHRYNFFYKRIFKAFPNIYRNERMLKIKDFIDEQRKEFKKRINKYNRRGI